MSYAQPLLLLGASGQLGSELRRLLDAAAVPYLAPELDELDLTSSASLAGYLAAHQPVLIINAAAYTAVDKAESERELAEQLNHLAPAQLAQWAAEAGAYLIHVSTDYVFDGTAHSPLKEEQPTAPLGVYGRTKRLGEEAIERSGCRYTILRTAWLYSSYGANFVKTMLRLMRERSQLTVVADQIGSPTYARDLAGCILQLLQRPEPLVGLYHFSNEGVASWYDFAEAIREYAGLDCEVLPIPTSAYPTAAVRPLYSLLDKAKIKAALPALHIPHWRSSLRSCLPLILANTHD